MFSGIKLAVLIVIALAIAGAISYHFVVVKGLNDQLAIERANNATLSENNGKLIAANATMAASITAMKDQFDMINTELGAIHEIDKAAADSLQHTQDFLNDPVKVKQFNTLRAAPNNEHLKDLLNRDSDCEFRHITEAGKCVNGNFVPAK